MGNLNRRIERRKKEYAALLESRSFLQGMQYASDKVQSTDGSSFTRMSDQLIDLEAEITREMIDLATLRRKVIGQIEKLENNTYERILEGRYIETKTLQKIADELGYSYYWTCHLHGLALQSFADKNNFLQKSKTPQ